MFFCSPENLQFSRYVVLELDHRYGVFYPRVMTNFINEEFEVIIKKSWNTREGQK